MNVIVRAAFFCCVFVVVGCDVPPIEGEGESGEGEGESGEGEGDFGGGVAGDVCSENADCGRDLRCGCDEVTGCLCEAGVRGTGENGVDLCVDENDCGSALCVEDSDGTFTCSAFCVDDGDCEARLPRCIDIAFVGRICARQP